MSNSDVLVGSLRSAPAPDALFSIAATASALIATSDRPGPLLVVHAVVLGLAHSLDGEAVTGADWANVAAVLTGLADFLQSPDPTRLDLVGAAWRVWSKPAAFQ